MYVNTFNVYRKPCEIKKSFQRKLVLKQITKIISKNKQINTMDMVYDAEYILQVAVE